MNRKRMRTRIGTAFVITFALLATSCRDFGRSSSKDDTSSRYLDDNDGKDWPGYGRTFGQQHYSPLDQINPATIHRLGPLWSLDLGQENSATQPIAVDGILYYATGLSVIHAVDALSGGELWTYDPETATKAGLNLRNAWGVRGVVWWNGKIYTGTQDGRLIAIDAKTGKPVWSVQTLPKNYPGHINGAPRVFDGKVIIGYGSTTGAARGYVTAYNAETGAQKWRFYTVPGNPAKGFENNAMKMAAKTWAGEWWKFGGGATVWNAIAYDEKADLVYIGTGSAYPWNRRVRSNDKGDNLFVASIVALQGKTGAYRWHYQVNPGDTWDYDATMDMELADLEIGGKLRKVLMQAPKNGFFYVLDRITGELISAEPYAKVTWASRIDLKAHRPVETPGARYPNRTSFEVWPALGAHDWMPMAFSPKNRLAYIPVIEFGLPFSDVGVDLKNWKPPTDRSVDGAISFTSANNERGATSIGVPKGALVAWNPVVQKAAWRVDYPTHLNGGVLATGGKVVLQGSIDGKLKAYSAKTGEQLWAFDVKAPIIGTPITYSVDGKQYVTLLSGFGMAFAATAGFLGPKAEQYHLDPRTQTRRVLTFALDAKGQLPPRPAPPPFIEDPDYWPDPAKERTGGAIFSRNCSVCHGLMAIGTVHAPDLRRSTVPLSSDTFKSVVHAGALVPNGMPVFPEFSDEKLEALRQYIRATTARSRSTEN